jgi:uncharacterized protein (TIGR03083 family)
MTTTDRTPPELPAPTDGHLQPLVAAQLLALADRLAPLPAASWDEPSLCEGWRAREVVAHMTMAARYGPAEFHAELEAAGFDFDTLSNRVAARDGALPPARLLADLRSDTMLHWAPPGGGYAGALHHAVVHGLDVTVPLGLERAASDEALRAVLDGSTAAGAHTHFGVDIGGLALRAVDLDWSHGEGRPVAAPAHELVALLSGRTVAGLSLAS